VSVSEKPSTDYRRKVRPKHFQAVRCLLQWVRPAGIHNFVALFMLESCWVVRICFKLDILYIIAVGRNCLVCNYFYVHHVSNYLFPLDG
jgi:hypothetical protein